MSRTKEQWLRETGGFRIGESSAQFAKRAQEARTLEADIKACKYKPGRELEAAMSRLRALKGIPEPEFDFGGDDDD